MNFSILINELEVLANAPNGMSLLRTLILDLALSGELNEKKMNFEKIRNIEDRIVKRRQKLQKEQDPIKKLKLRLRINIDELRVKLERIDK